MTQCEAYKSQPISNLTENPSYDINAVRCEPTEDLRDDTEYSEQHMGATSSIRVHQDDQYLENSSYWLNIFV